MKVINMTPTIIAGINTPIPKIIEENKAIPNPPHNTDSDSSFILG